MNETRRDAIRKITDLIHTDGIVVNGKLPTERALCELTDLNRLVLREALIAMEGMGILDIRGRMGIFLNESQGEEIAHSIESAPVWLPKEMLSKAMEMRQIIDPAAAALAAAKRTDEHIVKLENCISKMEQTRALGGEREASDGAYWNSILHNAIYDATGNTLLSRAHESVVSLIEKGVSSMRTQMPERHPEWRDMILDEHRKIVRAIVDAKPVQAKYLMEHHIAHTCESMLALGQIDASSRLIGTVLPAQSLRPV